MLATTGASRSWRGEACVESVTISWLLSLHKLQGLNVSNSLYIAPEYNVAVQTYADPLNFGSMTAAHHQQTVQRYQRRLAVFLFFVMTALVLQQPATSTAVALDFEFFRSKYSPSS